MRITGGKARGITLHAPPRGDIRPATDYLREAVFASLGDAVASARVLDCFAGTGAYGLEAMSRGAAHVTLLEQNAAILKCTRRNAEAVAKSAGFALGGGVAIRQADAVQWVKQQSQTVGDGWRRAQLQAQTGDAVQRTQQQVQVQTDAVQRTKQQAQAEGQAATVPNPAAFALQMPPQVRHAGQQGDAALYTMIFADPPYPVWEGQPAALLAALAALLDHSSAASRLVLEAPGNWNPPAIPGLELLRHLKKGPRQPSALIYRPSQSALPSTVVE